MTDMPNFLREEVARLNAALERAEWFLAKEGYRRCDIAACNCPYWHGGNASARLHEIYEALGHLTQGRTALSVIVELAADKLAKEP